MKKLFFCSGDNIIFDVSNRKGNKSIYSDTPKTLLLYEEKLRNEFNGYFSILISNSMDGYSVLHLLRRNHYVDAYETNEMLINGGNYDDFYTRGLLSK